MPPHVERHHGGIAEILREDIRRDEPDPVLDAGPPRGVAAVVDEVGVNLDPHGPAARLPGGLDDDSPVSGAEIVQDVILAHTGPGEQLGDDVVGGRQKRGIELDTALGVHVGAGGGHRDEVQDEGRQNEGEEKGCMPSPASRPRASTPSREWFVNGCASRSPARTKRPRGVLASP